jgi:predicted amidohydrolase YtcJ
VQNLGRARAEASNPMRAWIDAGMHPAAGSDAPVSATSPFLNIHAMVTRRTNHGTLLGPQQRIGVAEALHSYTWASAYTQFAEARRGRLVPGQIADIAVLSQDIFQVDAEAIPATVTDMTLRDGSVVFDRHA